MGGKPQKPKIQGYVDEGLYEAFEDYRQQHGLNQSQALGRMLAEFFGSTKPLPSPPQVLLGTASYPFHVLTKQLSELDNRLRIVEARLATESASKSAAVLTRLAPESASESVPVPRLSAAPADGELATGREESANTSDRLAPESANGLARTGLATDGLAVSGLAVSGLAAESVDGLAAPLDRLATESVDGLAGGAIAATPEEESDELEDVIAATPSQQWQAACDDWGFETITNAISDSATPSPESAPTQTVGLTRKELGKRFGVSRQTIANWGKSGELEKQGWKLVPGTGTGRGPKNSRRYRKI